MPAVALGATFIWLVVSIVNRRERWAVWMAVTILVGLAAVCLIVASIEIWLWVSWWIGNVRGTAPPPKVATILQSHHERIVSSSIIGGILMLWTVLNLLIIRSVRKSGIR
ncbi:MAG: hypothetical protein HY290_00640 [Planctomycetia bacterium]|nr:hypothetical protein [Planctomycetia bacterium]